MGTDFLSRTKKTIEKCIDTQKATLATHELFTVKPHDQPRSYVASMVVGVSLAKEETLIAEVSAGGVKLSRGLDVVASLDNPPTEILVAIAKSGGAARGVVQRIHELSRKAGVILC